MTPTDELLPLAHQVVAQALEAGAQETAVVCSRGAGVDLVQRGGKLEKSNQAHSRSLALRLMVDDRFSVHGTSDLRPQALSAFVRRAVSGTRHLEPDVDRALPVFARCGINERARLDSWDPTWARRVQARRREDLARLEVLALDHDSLPLRSCTAYLWDGWSDAVTVFSNGFHGQGRGTRFGMAVSLVLEDEDGRLPQAGASYSLTHQEDLPTPEDIVAEAWRRARRRLGSRPAPGGSYPMLVDRRAAGGVLGMLLSPMQGSLIYQGRSFLAGKVEQSIAHERFHLTDDPLIPRSPASYVFDGDGLPARRRVLVDGGRLCAYILNQYYARKMKLPVTGGWLSNLVVPAGERSPADLLRSLPAVIHVESFLGGDSNPLTGDFSFGVLGTLWRGGEPQHAVSGMNVAGNVLDLFARYLGAADDPLPLGSHRIPSLLFDQVEFSGR